MDARTRAENMLGHIVRIQGTGTQDIPAEYARVRLLFTGDHEYAGRVEIGLPEGGVLVARPEGLEAVSNYPLEMRGIPVFPDAADGSSRPMGVCERDGCGITANVIRRRLPGRGTPRGERPLLTWCTHCYSAQ
jgi:hypothetical protein